MEVKLLYRSFQHIVDFFPGCLMTFCYAVERNIEVSIDTISLTHIAYFTYILSTDSISETGKCYLNYCFTVEETNILRDVSVFTL